MQKDYDNVRTIYFETVANIIIMDKSDKVNHIIVVCI